MPLRPISSREGNHTSIGAGSHEEDGVEAAGMPPNPRIIQVTQEIHVVGR